jgi:hypothetical protein
MLGAGISGVVWEEMDEFSTFWCFLVKPAVTDCVSRAVMVVKGVVESEKVADDVGEVLYDEISQ